MYLYEMHQHTAPCSKCGHAEPARTVRMLKEAGFSGMVITNHFLHGNTGIDRDLPWEKFVRYYELDYLTAKRQGDEIDFDVIFGIEEHVGEGKEVLLYGITPEFLYDHPELSCGQLEVISPCVREFGGLVFQAHPYRSRSYIPDPARNLPVELLDGMETFNACNPEEENLMAALYARQHNLLACAGSDAHYELFENRFGIACDHRIHNSAELADALRNGVELLKG